MWGEAIEQYLQAEQWASWNGQPRTDPDLAAHTTITKQRGVCLQGLPVDLVFPFVPEEDYLASILSDLKEGLSRITADPVYVVLNASRGYAFVRERLICSKQEGAEWALNHVPEDIRPVVGQALESYAAGQQWDARDHGAIARLVAYMHQVLPLGRPVGGSLPRLEPGRSQPTPPGSS